MIPVGPTASCGNHLLALAAPSRPEAAEGVAYLLIILVVLTVVGMGAWAVKSLAHRRRYNSHAGLFSALCRVHELDRRSRRLLRHLARHHQLARAGQIFLDPGLFDPARLGQSLRARGQEIAALRTSLFVGRSETDAQQADAPADAAPALVTSPGPADPPLASPGSPPR